MPDAGRRTVRALIIDAVFRPDEEGRRGAMELLEGLAETKPNKVEKEARNYVRHVLRAGLDPGREKLICGVMARIQIAVSCARTNRVEGRKRIKAMARARNAAQPRNVVH